MDEPVGDVRAIELGGVDVVHSCFDRSSQDGKCLAAIARRPEDTGARQLHGAKANSADGATGQRVRITLHVVLLLRVEVPVGLKRALLCHSPVRKSSAL